MIIQPKNNKHEMVMLESGVPWSYFLLTSDILKMETLLFKHLYFDSEKNVNENKGLCINTNYENVFIDDYEINDKQNYMSVGNKFKIKYYQNKLKNNIIHPDNQPLKELKIIENENVRKYESLVLNKKFTVLNIVKDEKSKSISLYITEERLFGESKKKLQYELKYSIYKASCHSVLIKIEILFHPSVKIETIFTKEIIKKIVESIQKEIKNEKYQYHKVEESILIKSSRQKIMDIVNNFDKLNNSDIIYSRANKSSDKVDEIGDRYSFYQKSVSSYIELEIINVEYPESLNENFVKESQVIKSEPEIPKYKHKTELISIDEKKTLFNFSYKFQKPINYKKLALFSQDIKKFLLFVKISLYKINRTCKDKYV